MNVIEERIRAAAQAAGNTVPPDSVPPLRLPTAQRHRWLRSVRSAGATWTSWAVRLAPAAAVLAVIAIVLTLAALNQTKSGSSSSGASAAVAGPAGIPAGPPVSSYVASGRVPRYYVQVTASNAVVHLTASGATAAAIRPALPRGAVVAVASAGDGRTFILAEQEAGQDRKAISFYEVRLSPAGRPGQQVRLPASVPAGTWLTGLALSSGGGRLAIATQPGDGVQQVTVYPAGGGQARTWSARGGTIGTPFDTRSLSWTADQRTLAFNWSSGEMMSVRVLSLGSARGNLLAASRPVVTLGNPAGAGQKGYICPGNSVITPDGSAIVCPGTQFANFAPDGTIRYSTGFVEFSVATGLPTRVLGHWSASPSAGPRVMDVLWSDASGRILIGMIRSADRDWVGIVSGNSFTPLDVRWDPAAPDLGTW